MTVNLSQLVDSWNAFWKSVGGAPPFTYVVVAVSVLAAIFASRGMRRLWPVKPRGFHYGKAAERWARSRFPEEQRAIAAYVVELIHEQLGVWTAELERATNFSSDLGMDDLESMDLLTALEADLATTIPREDYELLLTIGDLIEYLYGAIEKSESRSLKLGCSPAA